MAVAGWGKNRAWRVQTALNLTLPCRGKRRRPDRIRAAGDPASGEPHLAGRLHVRRRLMAWPPLPHLQHQR